MSTNFDNTNDVIDSRDVIARIEELYDELHEYYSAYVLECEEERIDGGSFEDWLDLEDCYRDEKDEYLILVKLAKQGEDSSDWSYGETLIHEDYFTKYIEDLIDDCYEIPKEMHSGNWPWRHMTMDYEAAADEAKQDYFEVDFDGVTYYIRGQEVI